MVTEIPQSNTCANIGFFPPSRSSRGFPTPPAASSRRASILRTPFSKPASHLRSPLCLQGLFLHLLVPRIFLESCPSRGSPYPTRSGCSVSPGGRAPGTCTCPHPARRLAPPATNRDGEMLCTPFSLPSLLLPQNITWSTVPSSDSDIPGLGVSKVPSFSQRDPRGSTPGAGQRSVTSWLTMAETFSSSPGAVGGTGNRQDNATPKPLFP